MVAVGMKGYFDYFDEEYETYRNTGQCNVSGWRDIIAVSAGWFNTVGLKADGTIVVVSEYVDLV